MKSLISMLPRRLHDPLVRWASNRDGLPSPLTDETSADDVFIVGYPKSGITWFRLMAAALVYGADPEYLPNDLLDWLVPELSSPMNYKRWQSPMLFKSHDLPRPEFRRVVYLLRDGRDVLVSYYHFLKALGEDVDFGAMVEPDYDIYPCSWAKHVETWLANPHKSEMLIIKYEDLKTKPITELARFCEFLGISRGDDLVKLIVEKSSFARMRAKELKEGFHTFPKDKAFVRRGIVGSFKDEMPEKVLEKFTGYSKDTLCKLGYLKLDGECDSKTK